MPRPLRIFRDLERGEWELIDARPDRVLRPHVVRYTGWFERRATPLQRRELPSRTSPLIINFGDLSRVPRGGRDPMEDVRHLHHRRLRVFVLVKTETAPAASRSIHDLGARVSSASR